jgi:cell division protein FtsB
MIYFGYHAVAGERGIWRSHQIKAEIAAIQGPIESLRVQKAELTDITRRLNPQTFDKDYAEEIARRDLKMVRPDEYLVIIPAEPV